MVIFGINLNTSSSRHPQPDGASEVMKKMVKNVLHFYYYYHQSYWNELLPAADSA